MPLSHTHTSGPAHTPPLPLPQADTCHCWTPHAPPHTPLQPPPLLQAHCSPCRQRKLLRVRVRSCALPASAHLSRPVLPSSWNEQNTRSRTPLPAGPLGPLRARRVLGPQMPALPPAPEPVLCVLTQTPLCFRLGWGCPPGSLSLPPASGFRRRGHTCICVHNPCLTPGTQRPATDVLKSTNTQ